MAAAQSSHWELTPSLAAPVGNSLFMAFLITPPASFSLYYDRFPSSRFNAFFSLGFALCCWSVWLRKVSKRLFMLWNINILQIPIVFYFLILPRYFQFFSMNIDNVCFQGKCFHCLRWLNNIKHFHISRTMKIQIRDKNWNVSSFCVVPLFVTRWRYSLSNHIFQDWEYCTRKMKYETDFRIRRMTW